jgi:hypothetical protein
VHLSDARDAYDLFSGKVSDLSRQLSFAGIAVVWVFRRETPDLLVVPVPLVAPALCFCISLGFDLLHYVFATAFWGGFHRLKEQQLSKAHASHDKQAFLAPRWLNWPQNTCFVLKIIFVAFGYFLLVSFLAQMMLHPPT